MCGARKVLTLSLSLSPAGRVKENSFWVEGFLRYMVSADANCSKEARLLEEVTVPHGTLQRACSQKAKEAQVPVGINERKASGSGVAFS